jgi:hypothetical protein
MNTLVRMRAFCLATMLVSATAMASIGTAGTNCTVADYQAANDCLSGTFGTISGMFGSCDLACNDLGTGQPGGSASSAIWCGAADGAAGTVGAIGTVIQQQGNEILSCVTGGGVTHCVPVAVIVGGTVCAIATAGACVPFMAAGGTALALGNCAYQCLGSTDQDACQQACAGSIITTVGSAVAAGTYYGPQLCLPVSQVQWLPRPVAPVPVATPIPTPEPVPVAPPPAPVPALPPMSGGGAGLTAEELAALMNGIKQQFGGNGGAVGSAAGEVGAMNGDPVAFEALLAQEFPGLSVYEAMWQHMLKVIADRTAIGWPIPPPVDPVPPLPPPPAMPGPTPPPVP